jgi:hypothetical protein
MDQPNSTFAISINKMYIGAVFENDRQRHVQAMHTLVPCPGGAGAKVWLLSVNGSRGQASATTSSIKVTSPVTAA